jgi:hypothetical protein
MKRFLQYLAEDMPHQVESRVGLRSSPSRTPPESKSIHLGNIGPYSIHQHPYDTGETGEKEGMMISIRHKGKHIGEMTVARSDDSPHLTVDWPNLHRSHRGKRAKVKNLVPKVYGLLADKLGTIDSSGVQTAGGRSIWRRLAGMRKVKIARPAYIGNTVGAFSHPKHEGLMMSPSHFSEYEDLHNWREGGFGGAGVGTLKKMLANAGMAKESVSKIRTFADLPHPKTFREKRLNIKSVDQYIPAKHDPFIYTTGDAENTDDDSGKENILRLPPRR